MEHTNESTSVRLASLVRSPYNVRRHSPGQVEDLAALINAQGLLHNLVVTELLVGRGMARKVRFAVAAGERRRRPLLLLQQRGQLPKAHKVLCEMVPAERALEVSAAENSGREALHPADGFEAFKALIDAGRGVAVRFDMSVLTVQRWLKLSALSPKLLALYWQDGINLDQLMALALSDDHDAQERAWFEGRPWDRTPTALQAMRAGNAQVALAALANTLLRHAFAADYSSDRPATQISASASAHALLSVVDDLNGIRAFQVVEDAKVSWVERPPEQRGEWFEWLVGLPQGELLDLLSLCAALTVNAALNADAIARTVGLDMADWWEPTAEGFLNRLSKAQIVEALKEAEPVLAVDGVDGLKKDMLVNTAVGRPHGTRWLPAELRPMVS